MSGVGVGAAKAARARASREATNCGAGVLVNLVPSMSWGAIPVVLRTFMVGRNVVRRPFGGLLAGDGRWDGTEPGIGQVGTRVNVSGWGF